MYSGYVPNELIGLFDDEESAVKVAEIYSIELLSFHSGVAVFRTEGEPADLIRIGKEKAWPELSLNYIYKAF